MKAKAILAISLLMAVLIYSCESDSSIEFKRYYSSGRVVYQTRCQNCHGTAGQGLAALIPAVNDSTFLNKNKKQLSCIILKGINQPIRVSGKVYENAMPPVPITPIEIAQVITYVGNSFGNKMDLVDGDEVSAELRNCN